MPDTTALPDAALPTIYHESVTDFRRELCESAAGYRETMKPHQERVHAAQNAKRAGEPFENPSRADVDAYTGCLMAANYSYALAAVLGEAATFGPEAQQHLATVADDILMNGDDSHRNADVMGPCAECEEVTDHA